MSRLRRVLFGLSSGAVGAVLGHVGVAGGGATLAVLSLASLVLLLDVVLNVAGLAAEVEALREQVVNLEAPLVSLNGSVDILLKRGGAGRW